MLDNEAVKKDKGKAGDGKDNREFYKEEDKKDKKKEEIKKLYLCCAWRPLILNKRARNWLQAVERVRVFLSSSRCIRC